MAQEIPLSRRVFLKTAGAAGVGSFLLPLNRLARAEDPPGLSSAMPTRTFGRSAIKVPILALGGSQDLRNKQLLLRQALKMGVRYWDTAHSYQGGDSEAGIGKYFGRYPDDRKKIFLVTKTDSEDVEGIEADLETSLQRMKTDYIDLLFIHAVAKNKGFFSSDFDEIFTTDLKKWVARAKARGKIRLFGFSTHKNMARTMTAGAKLGWIDGIMASYNYRLMQKDDMKRAVDACVQAGIGLTAMKTQAAFSANFYASIGRENETAAQMAQQFQSRGFSEEQAKLKAVWDNPQIASICSHMPNMTILKSNTAAAKDRTTLSGIDRQLLQQHAVETQSVYCSACTQLCEPLLQNRIPVGEVMRCLMYFHGYGDRERAMGLAARLPPDLSRTITRSDYSRAEARCPQNIPIADLMKSALELLA